LIDEAYLPALTGVNSLVATPVTGAYGYSMASNYNRVPRPAVVFVRDGEVREVLRRETFEDLARLEVGI
jgi:diaminopimelate decarboxylase